MDHHKTRKEKAIEKKKIGQKQDCQIPIILTTFCSFKFKGQDMLITFFLYMQLTEEKDNLVRSKIIKHCIPQGTNAILFSHSLWSNISPYQVCGHANNILYT